MPGAELTDGRAVYVDEELMPEFGYRLVVKLI
jgi:hypothetical protein